MKKLRKVFAIFLSTVLVLSSMQNTALHAKANGIQGNLILQYNFDETSGAIAKDSSGHGNDGTLSSGAAWGTGKDSGGVVLKGGANNVPNPAYVTIPKGVMNGVHNVTIMADYYATAASSSGWLFSIGPSLTTTPNNYILLDSCATKPYTCITNGNWANNSEQGTTSSTAVTLNHWNNIAVVISNDTKTERLYLNGDLVGTQSNVTDDPASMYSSTAAFSGFIGKSLYSNDPYFTATVDNFRIYKTALGDSAISSIVNATISSVPSSVNVVTSVGSAPVLPSTVIATYTDGSTKNAPVTWGTVNSSSYASKGNFAVTGTVPGSTQTVTANVKVMDKLTLSTETPTAHTVNLNWAAENGATHYNVYRSKASGSGYTNVYQGMNTQFTDTNLDESRTYFYVVTYNDGTNDSDYSNEVSVTMQDGEPTVPVLQQGTPAFDSIALNWNTIYGADYYDLYRSHSADGTYTKIYSGTAISYNDSGLSMSSTYYYKICACNSYGDSVLSAALAAKTRGTTVADWQLNQSQVASGTAQEGNLVIKDASGNGNDLQEETYGTASDWGKYVNFSNESMTANGKGSMQWTAACAKINGNNTGADFISKAGASAATDQFRKGYTIELLYKFPSYWTTSQKWMSFLQRSGTANSISEPQGTFNVALSNCKETQVESSNADDNTNGSFDSAWGVTMDEGDKWYEISIVNDTKSLKVYLNGADGFRDITAQTDPSADLVGILADPNDGRFRIGSCFYGGTLDKLMEGNLQEVRVSDTALSQNQWLVPNPNQNTQNYGSNSTYGLKNAGDYTMAFFPDTQYEIEDVPQTMTADVSWLIKNKSAYRIKAVTHLGDVVQVDDSDAENDRAHNIFGQLAKNGVAYFSQPGNHDFYNSNGNFGEKTWCGVSTDYRKYWGAGSQYVTDFKNNVKSATLNTTSPSGLSSYMIVDAGSYQYMVLSLAWNQNTDAYPSINSNDMTWFENVLKANPNIPTIVTSHDLFAVSPTDPSAISLDNGSDDSANGTLVWNIVKKYNQVFMMVAGHNHGAGTMTLTNNAGNSVIGVLADYQFAYNGGEGWMKMLDFSESQNKLYLSTYSPYAASLSSTNKTFFDQNYLIGTGNYNEFNFDFNSRFAGMQASVYKANADAVSALIGALPINISLSDMASVQAARSAYDKLSNDEQPLVSNYDVLTADESIVMKKADQAAAKNVIDMINNIPVNVTLNDQSAVRAAQNAYDRLTSDQQILVTNYSRLTADEQILTVVNMIAGLPTNITLNDKSTVTAASAAYNALDADSKKLVTNYSILAAAESKVAALSDQNNNNTVSNVTPSNAKTSSPENQRNPSTGSETAWFSLELLLLSVAVGTVVLIIRTKKHKSI